MKQPIIAISPQYDIERNRIWIGPNYLNSIKQAGGIPILLPLELDYEHIKILSKTVDGFLFPGGPDIAPHYFNEEPIENYGIIVPKRDTLEEYLFQVALDSNKPMLGICRGMQIFNVFLGGSLYQDIHQQYEPIYNLSDSGLGKNYRIEHYQKSDNPVQTHSIHIIKNTLLHAICNVSNIRVNSFHHQSIKNIADSLIPSAFSLDDVVESIEISIHPYFLGVQWHPEHLSIDCPYSKQIFASFIDAC